MCFCDEPIGEPHGPNDCYCLCLCSDTRFHEPANDCSICHDTCCWKCLTRWGIKPYEMFAEWNFWCLLILGIPTFIMLVFGAHIFMQEKIQPTGWNSQWVEIMEEPTWANFSTTTTIPSQVIVSNNCTLVGNVTLPTLSCTNLPQDMIVTDQQCRYTTTCLKWQQKCSPCYYNCFTDDCWVQQQQQDCLRATKPYGCTVTYGDVRTVYSCTHDINSTIPTCQKDCPDFQCQAPTDYTCNCYNAYCLQEQTKTCYVARTQAVSTTKVTYTLFYLYVVDHVNYNNSVITQTCNFGDEKCKNDFLNQYNKTRIYYDKNNPTKYVTSLSSWSVHHAGGTYALVILGTIFMFLILCWCFCYCGTICRNCKVPPSPPKPPKAPKPPKQPKVSPPPKQEKAVTVKPQIPTQPVIQQPSQPTKAIELIAPPPGYQDGTSQQAPHSVAINITMDPTSKCIVCGKPLKDASLKVMPCRHTYHALCTEKCIAPMCNGLNPPTPKLPPTMSETQFQSMVPGSQIAPPIIVV